MLVKMKNLGNTVILNPFTGCKDDSFPSKLLLSTQERNYLVNLYDHNIPAEVNLKNLEVQKDESQVICGDTGGDEVPDEGSAQVIKSFEEKNPKEDIQKGSNSLELSSLEFDQNYEKIVQIYTKVKSCSDFEKLTVKDTLRLTPLEYSDKVLAFSGSKIKIAAKNEYDEIDPRAFIQFEYYKETPKLVLSKEDFICLFKISDWRNTYSKLKSSDERAYMHTFLDKCLNSKIIEINSQAFVVLDIDLHVSRIITDSLLSSAADSYNRLARDFLNMRENAIINGVSSVLENPGNDFQVKNDFFYEQYPSNLQVLKLISIILDLQEQIWLWTRTESEHVNSEAIERASSRAHTAYGRLSSFISWTSNPEHILNLCEEGYMNTSDSHVTLKNYLKDDCLAEDDLVKPDTLCDTLDLKYHNINVPLYKTLNYFPLLKHTRETDSMDYPNFEQSCISGVCTPSFSEFLATFNINDGSVCLWNSELHLF